MSKVKKTIKNKKKEKIECPLCFQLFDKRNFAKHLRDEYWTIFYEKEALENDLWEAEQLAKKMSINLR